MTNAHQGNPDRESFDVFVVAPDIRKHTGFAVNARLVCYALADEYRVANISENAHNPATERVRGRDVRILPTAKDRKTDQYADQNLSELLDRHEPDVVITLMNIRMTAHIPELRLPLNANLILRQLGRDDYAFDNIVKRTKQVAEKVPDDPRFKWVGQVPIDGHPLPNFFESRIAEMDSCVTMSNYGHRVLKSEFGIDTLTIPHAVDAPDDPPETTGWFPDDAFVVGAVNANDYRKQHARLIEAWGKFYRKAGEPDDVVFYLHTGRSDESGFDIDAYAQKYGVKERFVPYQGVVDRETLYAAYSDFDVMTSATGGEGFGLTTIEALHAGTPVVITDYTTSEELIVDGDPSPRGKLVDVKAWYDSTRERTSVERALIDTDDMADKIKDYYDRRARAERHGQNGAEFVRANYDYESVARAWKAHIDRVLAE